MKGPRVGQRGMTLVEMMITIGLMTFVMGGIVMFLVTHSRMTAGAFDRGDIQRSGRGALTVLEEQIGKAGLGLPKILAIKSFDDPSGDDCANLPHLEVAAVNYLKQWKVSGTDPTNIHLDALTTSEPFNPNPGGATQDVDIDAGQWLFIYTTASMDLNNPAGAFGPNRGHGMVQATGARLAGNLSIPVNGDIEYSGAQDELNLASTSELNNIAERGSVVMRADVSGFRVGCDNPDHPYLYWDHNGQKVLVASNVATPAIGGAVGLEFRFLLDLTGPVGLPDGQKDAEVGSLVIDPDPRVGTQDNVVAIEMTLRLRSDAPDPQLGEYRLETFTLLIQTPNIHTAVEQGDLDQLGDYRFIANTGI